MPISVYHPCEMPIHSCGQGVSAPREKAGAGLTVHIEVRTERQRSAREAIYRNRPITKWVMTWQAWARSATALPRPTT
jgi:hypothetical protein